MNRQLSSSSASPPETKLEPTGDQTEHYRSITWSRPCETSEYPNGRGCVKIPNPTHGREWMVQAQPTIQEPRPASPKSHPRQWVDGSSSTYNPRAAACFPNPTHGSGWMVQAQPTIREPRPVSRIPPTAVGGSFIPNLHDEARQIPSPNPTNAVGPEFGHFLPPSVGGPCL